VFDLRDFYKHVVDRFTTEFICTVVFKRLSTQQYCPFSILPSFHLSSVSMYYFFVSGLVVFLDVPVPILAKRLAAQAKTDKSSSSGDEGAEESAAAGGNAISNRPLLAAAYDEATGELNEAKLSESLSALLADRQVTKHALLFYEQNQT
jgi:hypothetical protein